MYISTAIDYIVVGMRASFAKLRFFLAAINRTRALNADWLPAACRSRIYETSLPRVLFKIKTWPRARWLVAPRSSQRVLARELKTWATVAADFQFEIAENTKPAICGNVKSVEFRKKYIARFCGNVIWFSTWVCTYVNVETFVWEMESIFCRKSPRCE